MKKAVVNQTECVACGVCEKNWCIKNKINIANMSFGMQSSSNAMHDIIIQADKAGIKMVTAAGNNYGGTALYPAAYPEVISVGAIDKSGNVADFSVQQNIDIFAYRD